MSERRRLEIEEKKAKLAELRRARDERAAILAEAERGTSAPLTTARRDVNELVDSLLASGRPTTPYASSSARQAASTSNIAQHATRQAASPPPGSGPSTPGGRISRMSNEGSVGASKPLADRIAPGPPFDRDSMVSPFGSAVDYVDHAAELYELPSQPKPAPVTYSKAIQTTTTSLSDVESESSDTEQGPARRRKKGRDGGSGRETEEEMRKRILEELEQERKDLEGELRALKEKMAQRRVVSDLSDEQRQAIYAAPSFSTFIEESTKIVQRALSDNYDYIRDYTIGADDGFDDDEGQKVKLLCAFSDERWTGGRSITDLDWSPKFHELVVASYNKNHSAHNDPDGIVAVWNLHLVERPEFVFHSPSDVLSVTFSPYHPNLIFGGSYSGQILLWDTRAKHLPVLKTPLSAAGHTYPIYAMKMVGTQNANNLISSSTDGLVCSWLTDMLAQPQEALPLSMPSHNKTDEISITSLDFPDNETSTFWVGTEEGSVYQANRYDRASAKAGLSPDDVYRGHAGPVTGLHFHPSSGHIDFSDLFLTSSVDWTVKLWRARTGKVAAGPPAGSLAKTKGQPPGGIAALHSFEEADDYVFDVKWHPHHPAVFGTVDGTGKFDVWNLNQDVETPTVSTSVSPRAINKLAFDRAPLSRKAGLGSSDGKLYIYDLAEKLVSPRDNEWGEMQKTVQSLLQNRDSTTAPLASEVPPVQAGTRYRSSLI